MDELETLPLSALLTLHGGIGQELRRRGLVRSDNNPVGDIAEHLFCAAFGWTQSASSKAGYDATDQAGIRYQIKCRRPTLRNPSRQMSDLRNLAAGPFDVLAALLFAEDYTILRAALIPYAVVAASAKYVAHSNAHRFILLDSIWQRPGVLDVTGQLRAAMP